MANTKLSQIIAIEKDVKIETEKDVTRIYHQSQAEGRFNGLMRTYQPNDLEGDPLPDEKTTVQQNAEEMLDQTFTKLTRLWDLVLTKDAANQEAVANIEIDGVGVLATDVPVTTLLWLEKQLVDLRTSLGAFPTLDPAKVWEFDNAQGLWVTAPTEQNRNKKVLRNHVKAEASDKHPAQVETYTDDVAIGKYTTRYLSGAFPTPRKQELIERVNRLLNAVKQAREAGNTQEIVDREMADTMFQYLDTGVIG
jgi:hypothetical protein